VRAERPRKTRENRLKPDMRALSLLRESSRTENLTNCASLEVLTYTEWKVPLQCNFLRILDGEMTKRVPVNL
jgi:hypothetical protein